MAAARQAPRHLEEAEQIALLDWASHVSIVADDGTPVSLRKLLIAIPNGAHLAGDEIQRAIQIKRLKRLGLQPGVADLFLQLARGSWHGLWIEMKKPRKEFDTPRRAQRAVSDDQRDFAVSSNRFGYRHVVCYGFDEARPVIEAYISGRDIVLAEGSA